MMMSFLPKRGWKSSHLKSWARIITREVNTLTPLGNAFNTKINKLMSFQITKSSTVSILFDCKRKFSCFSIQFLLENSCFNSIY